MDNHYKVFVGITVGFGLGLFVAMMIFSGSLKPAEIATIVSALAISGTLIFNIWDKKILAEKNIVSITVERTVDFIKELDSLSNEYEEKPKKLLDKVSSNEPQIRINGYYPLVDQLNSRMVRWMRTLSFYLENDQVDKVIIEKSFADLVEENYKVALRHVALLGLLIARGKIPDADDRTTVALADTRTLATLKKFGLINNIDSVEKSEALIEEYKQSFSNKLADVEIRTD